MDNSKKEENLGRAVFGIAYILFAIKFLVIATVITLPIVWLLGKPLWIAPVVAVILFTLYRIIWVLFFKFVNWSTKDDTNKKDK